MHIFLLVPSPLRFWFKHMVVEQGSREGMLTDFTRLVGETIWATIVYTFMTNYRKEREQK